MGRQVRVTMIDGTTKHIPLARIEVESPFSTGWVTAAVMHNSISDLVIGNIDGVKNACKTDAAMLTCAAAVTRGTS